MQYKCSLRIPVSVCSWHVLKEGLETFSASTFLSERFLINTKHWILNSLRYKSNRYWIYTVSSSISSVWYSLVSSVEVLHTSSAIQKLISNARWWNNCKVCFPATELNTVKGKCFVLRTLHIFCRFVCHIENYIFKN